MQRDIAKLIENLERTQKHLNNLYKQNSQIAYKIEKVQRERQKIVKKLQALQARHEKTANTQEEDNLCQ